MNPGNLRGFDVAQNHIGPSVPVEVGDPHIAEKRMDSRIGRRGRAEGRGHHLAMIHPRDQRRIRCETRGVGGAEGEVEVQQVDVLRLGQGLHALDLPDFRHAMEHLDPVGVGQGGGRRGGVAKSALRGHARGCLPAGLAEQAALMHGVPALPRKGRGRGVAGGAGRAEAGGQPAAGPEVGESEGGFRCRRISHSVEDGARLPDSPLPKRREGESDGCSDAERDQRRREATEGGHGMDPWHRRHGMDDTLSGRVGFAERGLEGTKKHPGRPGVLDANSPFETAAASAEESQVLIAESGEIRKHRGQLVRRNAEP